MSKVKKIVPELRFPEFVNDGEWEKKHLIDTANKNIRWSFTGGPFGSNLKASDYTKSGFRIIQLQNIGDGEFNDNYKIYASKEKADELLSCNIYAGDIIISKMGDPVGRACIIPNSLKRCIMASDGIRLVVNEKEYSKYFIFSLINSNPIRESIEQKSTGSTRKRIGLDELRNINLLIPKLPKEQQKIASCLSSLDDLIEAHNQKLDSLKDHKKGLMQNLFPQDGENVPKYRFLEFESDGVWKNKSFEELFEIGNGRDYKHLKKGEIPVYGSGGYMLAVDDYLYDGDSACIGRKGTIDKPVFLTGKFWTVDTLFYTHSFKDCIPKFIYYIFQNINWRNHNEAGGVPSLSKTNIYKIETIVPKPKEQKRIVNFLSGVDNLIIAQTDKIEELRVHKKGLMQGLFPKTEH
jgi:type I restriction enzyme S subunit